MQLCQATPVPARAVRRRMRGGPCVHKMLSLLNGFAASGRCTVLLWRGVNCMSHARSHDHMEYILCMPGICTAQLGCAHSTTMTPAAAQSVRAWAWSFSSVIVMRSNSRSCMHTRKLACPSASLRETTPCRVGVAFRHPSRSWASAQLGHARLRDGTVHPCHHACCRMSCHCSCLAIAPTTLVLQPPWSPAYSAGGPPQPHSF